MADQLSGNSLRDVMGELLKTTKEAGEFVYGIIMNIEVKVPDLLNRAFMRELLKKIKEVERIVNQMRKDKQSKTGEISSSIEVREALARLTEEIKDYNDLLDRPTEKIERLHLLMREFKQLVITRGKWKFHTYPGSMWEHRHQQRKDTLKKGLLRRYEVLLSFRGKDTCFIHFTSICFSSKCWNYRF